MRSSRTPEVVGWQLDALAITFGIAKPAREVPCVEGRRFRLDFAWPDLRVGCEYQGATWVAATGHSSGRGIERDAEKMALCQLSGWIVIPVTASMVRTGRAVELVGEALRQRVASQ